MRGFKQIDHFRLWKITSGDGGGILEKDFIAMLNLALSYFDKTLLPTFHLPASISFLDALRTSCLKNGIQIIPLRTHSERLALYVPIIARDRRRDAPALLLPYGPQSYVLAMEGEVLALKEIASRFDSMHQLFLFHNPKEHLAGDQVVYAKQFLPSFSLRLLSLTNLIFLSFFVSAVFFWISDYSENNAVLLSAAIFLSAAGTAIVVRETVWATQKNFALSAAYLLYDFYQNAIVKGSLHASIIVENAFSITKVLREHFYKRAYLIIASLISLLCLVVLGSKNALLGMLAAVGYLALLYVSKRWEFFRQDLFKLYQTQLFALEDLVEIYEQGLNSIIGLRAQTPMINLIERKHLALEKILRIFKLHNFFLSLTYVFLPLIYCVLFMVFLHFEPTLMPLWLIIPTLLFLLCAGLSLAYLVQHFFKNQGVTKRLREYLPALNGQESHFDLPTMEGEIEIVNMSFSYRDTGIVLFKNFSLKIEPGNTYVIEGRMGVGKSTLLKILMSALTPKEGQIIFDGHDGRGLDKNLLKRHFGVILEDARLSFGSIFNNIVVGRDIAKSALQKLLLSHEIFDCLLDLPMGLETYLFRNGKGVSNFERSIILLARALVHDPKILFIDDVIKNLSIKEQDMVLDYLDSLLITRVYTTHIPLRKRSSYKIIELHLEPLIRNSL